MPTEIRPRRSVLYMPGANPRALEKARGLAADALIFDLEDAVLPDAKPGARKIIAEALAAGGYGKREKLLRVNGLDTPWGHDDLAAAAGLDIHGVVLPKVESASTVKQSLAILDRAGAPASLAVWVMMETPLAMLHVEEIAASTPRLAGFVMGTSDLANDLHASHTRDRLPLLTGLSLCLLAARAYGLAILDGVYLDLADDEGFAYSCRQGVELGFDGKTLIHPKTIDAANAAYAPTEAEIAQARRFIAGFEAAQAEGKGVVLVDGKLVENLHVANSRRLVALADRIAELGERDMSKTVPGNFFEDFKVGQVIEHATPRTVTEGDTALYVALTGSRFALHCAEPFALDLGLPEAPIDDFLVFHMVFGKTVPDISLNAVANLGYAAGRFLQPVYPGDTVRTVSEVIGLKENSNGETGTVYVRSIGQNQLDEPVLDYCRWVMVRKRDKASAPPTPVVPKLPDAVAVEALDVPDDLDLENYDFTAAGSPHRWGDYAIGEKIDHVDGMTIEEAEHALATRLYQNTAKVHFNQHTESQGRFGRRLIYGGHVISLARALSFNGLANAFKIAALNGGRHVAPCFAGDTIYAWTEVLDRAELPDRGDVGALRLRTIATKDRACADFPGRVEGGYDPAVILELDYWALMPR